VLALLARKEEELRAAAAEARALAQRNAQLENDNVQLQARVSGEAWGLHGKLGWAGAWVVEGAVRTTLINAGGTCAWPTSHRLPL
jgi:hypothetical protein